MSGVIDVGDGFELTFDTVTGADVEVSWLDPAQATVFEGVPVPETPAGSGKYPYSFIADRPGVWEAQFRASGPVTAFEQFWVRATSITGPPPLAVLGDVTAQMALTAAQESLAKSLLRAASAMVRSRFPAVTAQIADGLLDPAVVALGITNMVLRVLRNPKGLRSESRGPFSVAYDTSVAAGLLAISDDDALLFAPPPEPETTGLYAVGTARIRPGMVPPPVRRRCW